MHIGLIGGIGPAATLSYYDKLVRSFQRAERPLSLTIAHADIKVLLANATVDNRAVQGAVLADHADRLGAAGCDVVTISVLTGHFCFQEAQSLTSVQLVSAIDPIDRFCEAQGLKTIGLLGSLSVMATHLYGQLGATRTVVPEDFDQVGMTYIEMAMSGQYSDAARTLFIEEGRKLCTEQEADAVLMAGTDLGLAFSGIDPDYRVLDAVVDLVQR
ncbi:Aspartate racemase [Candidatus Rhodobacter oscarellae]|uniref:Aspartate racemase n=1 Tax=Candidatus Rhodobacter oscarellae TaxID=1675527 RepID=A0A0J9E2K0_9RHOB|nr:aspartate/glutamate racemase family protein [Candidatus Rhodobacter lobularis]KMW56917.1 Aspartate racemase [Candidatus Rhodobacter lobularis]